MRPFTPSCAARQAVRAVYALGLDYGIVKIATTLKGETLVEEVDPSPMPGPRLSSLFAAAIERLRKEREAGDSRPEPLLLGADPEFLLRRPGGRIVSASRYMERMGEAGCDGIILRGQRLILPLAELRPEPSPSPRVLVENLKEAMLQASSRITDPELEWLTGGMPVPGFPLGGHIHFSGIPLTSRLLRTLDTYLALPLVLLEDEQSRRRRPRYGSLGDFRRKRHGGFEYRALPSWLDHPERAAGVLALARLIALSSDSLMQEPLDHPDIRKLYYAGDSTRLLPVARKLWEELETMPAYGEYGTELNRLKREILEETGRAAAEDFRPAWKIPPFGPAKTPLPEIMV
ncbi:hypothetical protein N6H14_29825 [Paenibacillus sp. CC-CFT747]|nr:hypothetical protein N6H14_29825 [Paenibacillus sp. CC-CFT747]